MDMVRRSSICLIALLISGCAIYPTTRTYYEPNIEDGSPTQSSSCGYHAAANDSLERQIGGISVVVSPRYKEGGNLSLTVSLHYGEEDVAIDGNSISATVNGGASYQPTNVVVNSYKKDNTHPNRMFLHLIYAVPSENVNGLSVELPKIVKKVIRPFRFKKTTKSDIYYASINC
jgi:hypothetical protein